MALIKLQNERIRTELCGDGSDSARQIVEDRDGVGVGTLSGYSGSGGAEGEKREGGDLAEREHHGGVGGRQEGREVEGFAVVERGDVEDSEDSRGALMLTLARATSVFIPVSSA